MSKELIISANRHETRVAVVEDDQVSEVFYQRENEYSLAGSIHKGRVTRVLPGMQSAFVDIGLERDAFLYVSDFFEDNDEYDKIVTSVEEKVFKQLDRPPVPQAAAGAAMPDEAENGGAVESVPDASLSLAPAVSITATATVVTAPISSVPGQERRDDRPRDADRNNDRNRDNRDGRGRRSRRRRGGQRGGGRALPDAKFYSPRAEGEARKEAAVTETEPDDGALPESPVETVRTTAPAVTDDFFVLPGESLAKYRAPGSEEPEEDEAEIESLGGEPFGIEEEEAGQAGHDAVDASSEQPGEPPEPAIIEEPPVEPQPEWKAPGDPVQDPEPAESAEGGEPAVEAAAIAEVAEDVDLVASDAAEPIEVAETEEGLDETGEEGEPGEEGVLAGEVSAEATAEQEGPEPARIPTSLTAALREQNPRYQHRVSRRMRRKGRDGQPREGQGPGRDNQARESQTRESQREVRGPAVAPEFTPRPQPEARGQQDSRSERPAPSISDLLKEGQEIIVQIAKEPLGQKGARITSHIALPGRFLVYMPTVDHIGVSRKIPSDEERLRLKRVLQTHRTGIPGGYIVRTAGEGRSEEELRADMMFLYNMWLDMRQKAERRPAPLLIHHDLNVVERILRDQLTSNFKSIWVDNEEIYENTLRFVQRFQPVLVGRVKMYTRPTPIFDEFGITAELEKALRPKVWLKSGGYIVINQTEALVAIDVNTGKFVGKSNRLEDTIVKTNTDAIKEIVRQIRLRDLGGIIVVDFIDMDERKNRQKVMQVLEEAMRADRAPYKILQFNDFGLVAITRKRVKQSLERTLCVPCSHCEGAGYVKSPQTVVGEILQEAHKIARAIEGKDVLLRVNPEVAKLLKSNQNTYLQEVEEILGGRTVIVKSDPQLHQEKFDLA